MSQFQVCPALICQHQGQDGERDCREPRHVGCNVHRCRRRVGENDIILLPEATASRAAPEPCVRCMCNGLDRDANVSGMALCSCSCTGHGAPMKGLPDLLNHTVGRVGVGRHCSTGLKSRRPSSRVKKALWSLCEPLSRQFCVVDCKSLTAIAPLLTGLPATSSCNRANVHLNDETFRLCHRHRHRGLYHEGQTEFGSALVCDFCPHHLARLGLRADRILMQGRQLRRASDQPSKSRP